MRRLALVCCVLTGACGDDGSRPAGDLLLSRVWRSPDLPGCTIATPLATTSRDAPILVAATSDGIVLGLSPVDGSELFRVPLPVGDGETSHLAATPALVGHRLIVAWMGWVGSIDAGRRRHRVGVIDLDTRAFDPAFPTIELAASVPANDGTGDVPFLPAHSYSRSRITTARPFGSTLGRAWVTFGNLRDIQPWHGWVFELDLDAWSSGGTAQAAVFLTTPEADCGPKGKSGSVDMICGGGVWSPGGPNVSIVDDEPELLVATGNGALDLGRRDYANSILRVHPGLDFDPACDPTLCADFDPIDPSLACIESCRDLFVPRLLPGDPPFDVPDGRCDGKTFFECYALTDWDLGANSPARVPLGAGEVVVIPAKDGGVYLADAGHLGTLHDRLQLTAVCGANGGTCTANWAGTMVTTPAITSAPDGTPVAIIPTFVFDQTNPAGIVALDLIEEPGAGPRLRKRWEAPRFDDPEAVSRFREHVGRPAIFAPGGIPHAVVVDPGPDGSDDGILYVVRVEDGAIVGRLGLDGPGRKYLEPIVDDQTVIVGSCEREGGGPSHLEAWGLE